MSARRTPNPWPQVLLMGVLALGVPACWGTSTPGTCSIRTIPGGGGPDPEPIPPPGPPFAPDPGNLLIDGPPTLDATAPQANATGIDVQAPIGLWFNETINPSTTGNLAVTLRAGRERVGLAVLHPDLADRRAPARADWIVGMRRHDELPRTPSSHHEGLSRGMMTGG